MIETINMLGGLMPGRQKSPGLLFFLAATCTLPIHAAENGHTGAGWQRVYQDNYDYSQDSSKFNTWFWREDDVGTHEFEYTKSPPGEVGGCSKLLPCVKLIAPKYGQANVHYINGEMYNNSCVRKGPGHPEEQAYDRLQAVASNPWMQTPVAPDVLYKEIGEYCGKPYPYRKTDESKTSYVDNSWNTSTGARLYSNPLAYLETEPDWQWYRDLAFNSPYLADASRSEKISMHIKAEGEGGGSRGWGYWNTSMDPFVMQFAWFMELSQQASTPPYKTQSSVWMMTVKGGKGKDAGFCLTPLDQKKYSVYKWRDYEIAWNAGSVDYYVDQHLVAQHRQYVPDTGMAFHNWVDNRNYFTSQPQNYNLYKEKSNYINQFSVHEANRLNLGGSGDAAEEPASGKTVCMSFETLQKDATRAEFRQFVKMIMEAYR